MTLQIDPLNLFIAAVWLVNGFYCKVLGAVPRHRAIVARILGEAHAGLITLAIGFAEICMTLWIVSGIQSRFSAVTQIVIIAAMNILEYFLARDLLLWGRANACIALLFIILIYYRQFAY
ncbi:MAG: DoxX-like family protein [Acidobacteriota bacterium]